MIVPRRIPPEIRWFAEARFGMFVHFGLYALLGRGEWVMYHEGIPRGRYERLARRFNPHRFDADAWVGLAQEAGARYINCTAKHHDGFCLFDSALTDFKSTNTPFRRDLIGELIGACQRADMRIILYYSQPDWHHPNYVHRRGAFKDLPDPPATDRPDWPRYVEYYVGQVRELCSNYGRIDGIWFDGSHKTVEEWRGREVYRMIKRLQPTAVVNDRARHGDFFTPERRLPDDLTGYLFEACQSVSPEAWGYRAGSALYSAPYLVRSLVRMAANGGNYLLNVGPAPDGSIPEDQAERMRAVGRWLKTHGEAIYATQVCPLPLDPERVRATRRPRAAYLHLVQWPETDVLPLPGVADRPVRAELMGAKDRLTIRRSKEGWQARGLPSSPPDGLPRVVKLTFARQPRLRVTRPRPARPKVVAVDASTGAFAAAESAAFRGRGVKGGLLWVRREEGTPPCVAGWIAPEQQVVWSLDVKRGGEYEVSLALATEPHVTDAVVRLRAGKQALEAALKPTGGLGDIRRQCLGRLRLAAGRVSLVLWPARLHFGYVFPLIAGVALRPSFPAAETRR